MTVPAARLGPRDDPREAACAACRTRTCCSREVALTIGELAAIARTLAVSPSRFAELAPARPAHGPAPLRLAPDGPAHHLVLRRPGGTCAFLLHLGSGRRACGLGPLAPAACRDFPIRVDLDPAGLAPSCWRPWSTAELPAPTPTAPAPTPTDPAHTAAVTAWHTALAPRLSPLDPATALDALLAFAPPP